MRTKYETVHVDGFARRGEQIENTGKYDTWVLHSSQTCTNMTTRSPCGFSKCSSTFTMTLSITSTIQNSLETGTHTLVSLHCHKWLWDIMRSHYLSLPRKPSRGQIGHLGEVSSLMITAVSIQCCFTSHKVLNNFLTTLHLVKLRFYEDLMFCSNINLLTIHLVFVKPLHQKPKSIL